MTTALFALVAVGCAVLACLSRGEDRLSLVVAALGWAGIAVLAYVS
jgi:hypothetical protein